jgi:polyphosphate kinase
MIPPPPVVLPERERREDYSRQAVPPELMVPAIYRSGI